MLEKRTEQRLQHWMNLVTGSLKLSNFLTLPGEIYKSTQLLVQLLQEKNQSIRMLSPCSENSLWNAKSKRELISCLFPWGKMVITILAMNLSGDVVPIALLHNGLMTMGFHFCVYPLKKMNTCILFILTRWKIDLKWH